MKRKKRIIGVLIIAMALMIMLLPGSEAGAQSSASDFKMEGSTLVKYKGTEKNVSIPSTVEVIGKNAFEDNKNVELVVIPNSVKRIEPYAFWGCENLDSVVLGRGLSEVGDYAFTKCTGLEQIVIPANITSIGIQAFGDCKNLKIISIPKETTSIHETAFEGCTQLTISCEEGTAAAEYAESFYERQKNMPGYDEVPEMTPSPSGSEYTPVNPSPAETAEPVLPVGTVPQGNLIGSTYIVGNKAVVIVDNTQLQVFGSGNGQTSVGSVAGDMSGADYWEGKLVKYTIIDGTTVADQAYYRNSLLDTVVLPDGIREIGEFAYARSSLTSVVLPEGAERIGYGAFYHCDDLSEVVLPDTILCVEPKAFSYTAWVIGFFEGRNLEAGDFLVNGGVLVAYRGSSAEVEIPEGVRVIAGEAFLNHTEIEKVSLPDSLLVVGEGAFEGCSNLGEIDFGSHVQEIKDRAFLDNAMSTVSLPVSVKKVGLQAFGNSMIAYKGAEAEYTYEPSATRLSNAAYRKATGTDGQDAGVTVEGLQEIFGSMAVDDFRAGQTSLTEADGPYTLTVSLPEDSAAMDAAFERALQSGLPEGMVVYDLHLTDGSGIPLKKLGNQMLGVVLPLPESLAGQELRLFTLDGNGQLERLTAERIEVDGIEAFRFQINYMSMIGICGVQNLESGSE